MISWKDNVSFILIEPKEPGNIGSSARAMKNMGFKNLELVNPPEFLTHEARQMACNSAEILETARVCSKLKDAIEGKNLVVGTTRRLGSRRGLILPLRNSIKRIITAAKRNKVAVLFGREKNGLTNQEIEKCGFLVSIPADPSFPSLNLAQGVMLVAYELGQKTYRTAMPPLVKHEELEAVYQHIRSALSLLGYIPRGHRDLEAKIMSNLKHLIGRAGLTEWELKMIRGICSQAKKKIKN